MPTISRNLKVWFTGLLLLIASLASAQFLNPDPPGSQTSTNISGAPTNSAPPPIVTQPILTERGPNHQVWQHVTTRTNRNGQIVAHTNSVVELQTGMYYQTNDQWLTSRAQIQLTPNGAAALEGYHKASFAPDLNTSTGAVHLVTGDNKHLRSRVMGLAYHDYQSGNSVLIAELTNAPGLLVGDNRIIYTNAMTDFRTDVRYTYTKAGLEQDIILRERPPLPEDYGLNPSSTRLEVWTEFFDPPPPQIEKRNRRGWHKATVDRVISFGEMKITHGVSFNLGDESQKRQGVPVEKHWEVIDGRSFLVEEVSFRWLVPQMGNLPRALHASTETVPGSVRHIVSNRRLLPTIASAQKPATGAIVALNNAGSSGPMEEVGLVIDYRVVHSTDNFTFQADTTYKVDPDTTVHLGGTTTIEGGTVIKYGVNSTIELDGELNCLTGPYRPAILTAVDDNTAGDPIGSGSLSGTYADVALALTAEADLKYLDIRYASEAINSYVNYAINHCQILHCTRGLDTEYATFTARNLLMYDVGTMFYGSWFHGSGENLTLHQATLLTDDPDYHDTYQDCSIVPSSSISLANSLLYEVTGEGIVPLSKDHTYTATSNPFQIVGGGAHYLATNSQYRDAGVAVNPDLVLDLRTKTTFPPVVLADTNLPSVLTNLFPRTPRDTNDLDIGFHYDPIDWEFGAVMVTNSLTVSISPGTVIAGFGTNNTLRALTVANGSQLLSCGTPLLPVRVVGFNTVQENVPANWLIPAYGLLSDDMRDDYTPPPGYLNCRFTDFSSIGKDVPLLVAFTSPAVVRDSQFHGGYFYSLGGTIAGTNCVFERSECWFTPQNTLVAILQNNLFYGGQFNFYTGDNMSGTLADNLFARTEVLFNDSTYAGGHNAFVTNSLLINYFRLFPTNAGDILISDTDFISGPLGRFYYPTNGGKLSRLYGAGSANAANVGLFHYTVDAWQVKETNSTADVGFHYVALTNGPQDFVWVEDNLPYASWTWADHDSWTWVTNNPYSYSGSGAHKSDNYTGLHHHVFGGAANKLLVRTGDKLFCYVYLDPANPPQEIMLEWLATDYTWWYHRAYWGANNIDYGDGHPPVQVGDLPPVGGWYRLEVPASLINLETRTIEGMSFTLDRGVVTWDRTGLAVSSWVPVDTDLDGLPDYVEDTNGDGLKQPNETDFRKWDTDADGLNDGAEILVYHTDPNNPDSDYDGMSDGQEIADHTNPLNPDSAKDRRLGYWRFNVPGTWAGEQGQLPLSASLHWADSWTGSSGRFTAADQDHLVYRDYETNGNANINLQRGSIRFWFKPDWSTFGISSFNWTTRQNVTGSGPGHAISLIEVGHSTTGSSNGWWVIGVNPNGTQFTLTTEGDGVRTVNLSSSVQFQAGKWYQICLTYTNNPGHCALYINGNLVTTGSGIVHLPPKPIRQLGFRIACGYVSGQQAEGGADELETFNYPLSSQSVRNDYQGVMKIDTDNDGLPDVVENEIHTYPNNRDSDDDGIPDGWEYAHLRLSNSDHSNQSVDPTYPDANNDPDEDHDTNVKEYINGTDPLNAENRNDQPGFAQAAAAGDLININFVPGQFTPSCPRSTITGPAAAGYNGSDIWNSVTDEQSTTTFRTGLSLVDAANGATSAKLWSFHGPYRPTWNWNRQCCYRTRQIITSNEVWYDYWNCWWHNLSCLYPFGSGGSGNGSGNNNSYYDWSALFNHLELDPWYLGLVLPRLESNYLWLPALDLPGRCSPLYQYGGVLEMTTENLATKAASDSQLIQWLYRYGFQWLTNTGLHIYLTGLEDGAYQIYVYSYGSPSVNGQAGMSKTLRVESGNATYWTPYSRSTVRLDSKISELGNTPPTVQKPKGHHNPPDWERDPIWLPHGPHLEITGANPAGMQIVRLHPLPAPVSVSIRPGKRALYLSWDRVATAEGYQIYRSLQSSSGFTFIANTDNRTYADGNLADVPYYYYIVATNAVYTSPASSVVHQTPLSQGQNSAPILNYIKPIELSVKDGTFEVPFLKVLRNSDARDMDGDAVYFKVESVLDGSLSINGQPFARPVDLLHLGNCTFDASSTVIWTPSSAVPASGIEAFRVQAFDGFLRSVTAVPVKIVPVPQTYLLGWGADSWGSLGDGDTGYDHSRYAPELIKLSPSKVKLPKEVVAIKHNRVPIGASVTADGALWMWGNETGMGCFGEGQPSTADIDSSGNHINPVVVRETPFKVQMFPPGGNTVKDFTNVTDVSIGFQHVLATRSDGTLWSWGANHQGQLGRNLDPGETIAGAVVPATKKAGQIHGISDSSGRDLAVVQSIADWGNSLALCADGSVWWWGTLGFYGVDRSGPSGFDVFPVNRYLTESDQANAYVPNRLAVFDTGPRVIQITGGDNHFMALREDGTVWEFGYVPRLRLLDPPATSDPLNTCGNYCYFNASPVQVTNLPQNVVSIRADGEYAMALLDDGRVFAWGQPEWSWQWEAGFQSAQPVEISGLHDIVKIDWNELLATAMDRNGNVWAWGYNDFGALGQAPSPYYIDNPQLVFGVENAKDVASGSSAAFAVASIEEGKPTGLVATPLNNAVRLAWRRYPGASSYRVYRATQTGGPYDLLPATPISNSYTDSSDVQNGTAYFYAVSAIVDAEETPKSREAMAIPLPPPAAPTWSSITPVEGTCHSILLEWNASLSAADYIIYRSTSAAGPFGLLGRTSATTFADGSASPGTSYYYRVVAENSAGPGDASATSAGVQLTASLCAPAPTITGLTSPADSQVTITWTEVTAADMMTHPEAYRLKWYYQLHDIPPNANSKFIWREIPVSELSYDGTDQTYSYTLGANSEIDPEFLLWFKVSAVLDGEEGSDSAIAGPVFACHDCSPAIPGGLSAVAGYQQVYLTWQEVPKAAFYKVEYRIHGAMTWILLNDHVIENRFWHTGLVNGTTYDYRVSAAAVYTFTEGSGTQPAWSDPSDVVSATPLSTLQPPNISFTLDADAYDSEVFLHWESLGYPPPYPCFVERKLDGAADSTYEIMSDTGLGLAFMDDTVVNNTAYTYRVTALGPNYHRFRAVKTGVTPIANGNLVVTATPGNAHVRLTWNPVRANRFEVKHALQPGGPYDVVEVTADHTFTHANIQNGLDHYYVVTAILAADIAIDSAEVTARPLATLAPLPPANLRADNGVGQIVLSWSTSGGTVESALYYVSGSTAILLYRGAGNSFAFPVPSGTQDGDHLTFRVQAFNAQGVASLPTEKTFIYVGETQGAAGLVAFSIGDHQVTSPTPPALSDSLVVRGPTNLVLHASVSAADAGDGTIYFYDGFGGNRTLIGSGPAPDAQVTWFNVPAGAHFLFAEVITAPPGSTIGGFPASGAQVYDSYACALTNNLVPELDTFQTALTDLQLPAPGLPIALSRSYDSRRTTGSGILGKGWNASWDEPSLQFSTALAFEWKEGPLGGFGHNQYFITESGSSQSASHLITITLPGGATVYFAPQLTAESGGNPLAFPGSVSLNFQPFSPNQGSLSCSGNGDTTHLTVIPSVNSFDWDGAGLTVYADDPDNGGDPFVPDSFTYTDPSGTDYHFNQVNSAWKLVSAVDRNGNSLTYTYDSSSHKLLSIQHGNGRKVEFEYISPATITDVGGSSISGSWIKVYDTLVPKSSGVLPVLKYFVQDAGSSGLFLREADRLVNRAGSGTYEPTRYNFGSSGDSLDRLTEIYDARGIRILGNGYGNTGETPPVADGRLISQTNASLNVTSYYLDPNDYTLWVTNIVNGVVQTSIVTHASSGAIVGVQTSPDDPGKSFTYDDRGHLQTQTDAAGNTSTITYDGQDRPVTQSDPLGHTSTSSFNELNEPVLISDANGNTNYFDYDGDGNLASSTDAAGVQTDTDYATAIMTSSGNVIAAAGLVSTETKHAPGVPYTIVTAYGYYGAAANADSSNFRGELYSVTEKWVDSSGQIANPVVPPTIYTYDKNGNRLSESRTGTVNGTSGQTVSSQFAYDPQNRLLQTTDPSNRVSYITYNKLGKQAITTDVLNRTTTYIYDVLGNLIETQYPDGTVTRTIYDAKNRAILTQERAHPESGTGYTTAPATTNILDADGRLICTRRCSGVILAKQTDTSYVGMTGADTQYKIVVSNAGTVASLTRTVYDLNGRVKYAMDARGTVTESGYDKAGRRTTNRVYTAFTVTPLETGSLVPSANSAYLETLYGYDPAGNQIWVKDALGHQTDFEYDEANRLIRTWFPKVSGDLVRKCRSTVYDGLGQRLRETDEAGVITAFTYDFRGLLTAVTQDAFTTNFVTTSYGYDEFGHQISQTNANQNVTQFQCDKLGHRTKRILPDNSFETVSYEDVPETTGSNIKVSKIKTTDFRGKSIIVTNDRSDRIKSKLLPAINSLEADTLVSYDYTDVGLLNRVDMSGNVIRTNYFAYDNLRRVTRKDTPEGVLAYTYAASGLLQTTKAYRRGDVSVNTDPGSATPDVNLSYDYDTLGRLHTVTDEKLSSPNATTYTYEDVGNLASFTYPNGLKHAYVYTEQNRLKTLTLTRGDNSLVRGYAYDLAPSGNRVGVAETELSGASAVQRRRVTYEYDKSYATPADPTARVYRLTRENLFAANNSSAGTLTHVYDKVGNRISRTATGVTSVDNLADQSFTFDSRDQLSMSNGSYDENGNTLKDENGNATGDKYDAENHLIARGSNIQIGYDADGNRAWKTVGSTTTYYLLDDRNPSGYVQVLAEYSDTSNPPDRAYTYGHELIAQRRNTGSVSSPVWTTSYYGLDGQSSVRLLTDSTSSASVTDNYDYDAYGILLSASGTTPNDYRYTGQQWDSDLGMYFLRARYYQPRTGRFWTIDSFEGNDHDPLSLHKYVYCNSNPINGLDLTGHEFNYVSLGSAMTLMVELEILHIHAAANATRKAYIISGCTDPQLGELIYGLEIADIVMDKLSVAMAAHGIVRASVKCATFLAEEAYNFPATASKTVAEFQEFLTHGQSYRSYKDLAAALKNKGLSTWLHAHHLVEKTFAKRLGLNPDEIIAAPVTKDMHINQGGGGVNIHREIEAALNELGTTVQDANIEQIWKAHKKVYEQILRAPYWAKAIFEAYFKDRGLSY